jgi:hypothetical protein
VTLTGGVLAPTALRNAGDFIERAHAIAALTRRAFYEAFIEAAVQSKKGTIRALAGGVLDIQNQHSASVAMAVASGRPARLADVHKLSTAAPANSRRLLAGQHKHLPLAAYDDLTWLASVTTTTLSGRADIYREVQALL